MRALRILLALSAPADGSTGGGHARHDGVAPRRTREKKWPPVPRAPFRTRRSPDRGPSQPARRRGAATLAREVITASAAGTPGAISRGCSSRRDCPARSPVRSCARARKRHCAQAQTGTLPGHRSVRPMHLPTSANLPGVAGSHPGTRRRRTGRQVPTRLSPASGAMTGLRNDRKRRRTCRCCGDFSTRRWQHRGQPQQAHGHHAASHRKELRPAAAGPSVHMRLATLPATTSGTVARRHVARKSCKACWGCWPLPHKPTAA